MDKKNILLVDDDSSTLQILSAFIKKLDCDVFTANNGTQALDILSSVKVDCVVSDIEMPEMDGITLLEKMSETHESIPTIIMTKFDNLKNIRMALKRGAFDFFQKPLKKDIVLETVELALVHGKIYNTTTPTDKTLLFWKKNSSV